MKIMEIILKKNKISKNHKMNNLKMNSNTKNKIIKNNRHKVLEKALKNMFMYLKWLSLELVLFNKHFREIDINRNLNNKDNQPN